ncbi:MAG TPA: DUF402 domain-containing protein [Clostridia bacterium]|jgi:hypothetical protein|nr:DUF402 domain-containing protein [Clostridia bacterium]HPQ47893.1 DUF402 domain-containing protein [Clostridia bacterium]HRX42011.1 DUF402 domain-containing protein [Clostridia bacterium]
MPDRFNEKITMKAYKYDGRLHYEQELDFVDFNNGALVLAGRKGRKLRHYTRDTVFTFEEKTLEYFFEDRWYTAALVFDDSGKVIHVYCNIALPAKIQDGTVSFVDLDIDVIVRDGIIEVVDEDEFRLHKEIYGYGIEIEKRVYETVDLVKSTIINGEFPFNMEILAKV